jgi:hypothetical protein
MSLTSSLTQSVRSATYNPEAEKAMAAEREGANKVAKEIGAFLDETEKTFLNLSSKPLTPKWTLDTLDAFLKENRKWLKDHPEESEVNFKAKKDDIVKKSQEIFLINQYLYVSNCFEKVMVFMQSQFEQKKQLNAEDRRKYTEFYEKLKANNEIANKNPKFSELKVFLDKFTAELEAFSKPRGIWEQQQILIQNAFQNPQKFEADLKTLETQSEEIKKEEEKKFSAQRFVKKVSGTASKVIGSLFYITFCIVIGMMAANQAIGRAPAYRVLYFIYGALFAPILVFYYIYLWFKDQSPKIYTLLPVTTMKAETTLGKIFLFPFAYSEDKSARDLLVEFMTQSAELVGKTFDASTLGTIGQQAETVAENLKNLTAETKEAVEQSLPKLNSLRVNA